MNDLDMDTLSPLLMEDDLEEELPVSPTGDDDGDEDEDDDDEDGDAVEDLGDGDGQEEME